MSGWFDNDLDVDIWDDDSDRADYCAEPDDDLDAEADHGSLTAAERNR